MRVAGRGKDALETDCSALEMLVQLGIAGERWRLWVAGDVGWLRGWGRGMQRADACRHAAVGCWAGCATGVRSW